MAYFAELTLTMVTIIPSVVFAGNDPAAARTFVASSCSATLYSKLCLATLSPHADTIGADPIQLANTALNLTTSAAVSCLASVKRKAKGEVSMKPMQVAAFRDCVEMMETAVDQLQRSSDVLARIGGSTSLGEELGNIQTWVSAAITNGDTCLDGLREHSAPTAGTELVQMMKMTSNALFFINSLVAH